MGYAPGRWQRLVGDEHDGSAHAASEDGLPLFLRSGRAAATWSHRFQGDWTLVKVAPFQEGVLPQEIYERTFGEIG